MADGQGKGRGRGKGGNPRNKQGGAPASGQFDQMESSGPGPWVQQFMVSLGHNKFPHPGSLFSSLQSRINGVEVGDGIKARNKTFSLRLATSLEGLNYLPRDLLFKHNNSSSS